MSQVSASSPALVSITALSVNGADTLEGGLRVNPSSRFTLTGSIDMSNTTYLASDNITATWELVTGTFNEGASLETVARTTTSLTYSALTYPGTAYLIPLVIKVDAMLGNAAYTLRLNSKNNADKSLAASFAEIRSGHTSAYLHST